MKKLFCLAIVCLMIFISVVSFAGPFDESRDYRKVKVENVTSIEREMYDYFVGVIPPNAELIHVFDFSWCLFKLDKTCYLFFFSGTRSAITTTPCPD